MIQSLATQAWEGPDSRSAIVRWLEYPIVDNSLGTWLMAVLVAALVYFGVRLFKRVLVERLRGSSDRFTTRMGHLPDKLLADIRPWCILALAVFAGSRVLVLPVSANSAIRLVFVVAVSVQILLTSRIVVDFVIAQAMNRNKRPDGQPDPSITSASGIIRFMAMLVLGALLVLLALANLGVEITPLITGLGIGGIAVALAAQSILGDLFGSLTILFDKPFLVGDFIVIGDKMGTVESIGVKTTRLRALSGEQLVFSNSDLLSSRIQNFKRMELRRASFVVNVVFETPMEKVERIPGMLREIVESQQPVRVDRSHFRSIGEYALEFELVYFVLSADYNVYADIQQAINFGILRRFAAEEISMAYPTQLAIHRGDPPASARAD